MDDDDKQLTGSCPLMCPETETTLRKSNNLLHWLEIDKGYSKVDTHKEIKEYSRPAAGKSDPVPCNLRPAPVLLKTTKYLINRIIPNTERQWYSVYEFVFDRLRAIRQDMTIQRICDSDGVKILEQSIRVMVYAHYRLCEEPIENFDAKINSTHIQECLKRLLNLYDRVDNCCCYRPEFVALYLLFNLGSMEALLYGLDRKYQLRSNSVFDLALGVSLAWWRRNYVRCVKLARCLPVLHICAIHNNRHLFIKQSLMIMCSAYNSKNLMFPLNDLTKILDMNDSQEAESYCTLCGIQSVPGKGVKFIKGSFKQDSKITARHHHMIEDDLAWEDISQLMLGNPCQCSSSAVT